MSRRIERKFTKPAEISKHLFCPICIEVFLDPTRLFCGHTFCAKCITQWANDHNSCPVCRETIEMNLSGKDLIGEKIIQDLEVFCPNKLCDWKDRLENLNKHASSCAFDNPPNWLKEAQNYIHVDGDTDINDVYLQDNECYIQRINEEVSRKSFLERLYTKDLHTRQLVDSVFNKEQGIIEQSLTAGIGTIQEYDNFLLPIGESEDEDDTTETTPLSETAKYPNETIMILRRRPIEPQTAGCDLNKTILIELSEEPIQTQNTDVSQDLEEIDMNVNQIGVESKMAKKRICNKRRYLSGADYDEATQHVLKKKKIP